MLRAQFTNFGYRPFPRKVPQDPLWQPLRHSCDLLQRIAAEPIVARYILHADLNWDHWPPNRTVTPDMAEPDIDGDPVVALFANSPYFQRAGLDWRQYYCRIADDFQRTPKKRFSQHATAFVLTLLPNARALRIPKLWNPTDASSQLVHAVASEARRHDSASLARVTRFDADGHRLSLADAMPFLALPRMQCYHFLGVAATDMLPGDLLLQPSFPALFGDPPKPPCSSTLEDVDFLGIGIDAGVIVDLLRFAPRLTTLDYSHRLPARDDVEDDADGSGDDAPPRAWDISAFLLLLEREAGHRLERLAVTCLDGVIAPGAISLRRGFPRLRELVLAIPAFEVMALAPAIVVAAAEEGGAEVPPPGLDDCLPASLEKLTLVSENGSARDARTLATVFRGFAARRTARPLQLPALRKVRVELSDEEDNVHPDWKRACAAAEAEMALASLKMTTPLYDGISWWEHDNFAWPFD